MDYPCAKLGECSFSRFGFIVQTDRQTWLIALLARLLSDSSDDHHVRQAECVNLKQLTVVDARGVLKSKCEREVERSCKL